MPTVLDLEHEITSLSTKAYGVASDDSRPWSERAPEIEKMEADIKGLIDTRDSLKAEQDTRARLAPASPDGQLNTAPEVRTVKSIGQIVTESENFKAVRNNGQFSTGAIEVDAASMKATFTEAAGAAGLIVPQYLSTVTEILFRRLVVADLFPQGSISGNTLIYPKESSVTNAAAAVAEGGAKPASDLNVVQVTETLKKIATILKVSDETLRDVQAAMSYIDARLTLFVKLAEEDQLLNGSGSGANMTGLLNRSGLTAAEAVPGSPTSTDRADSIYKEITKIRSTAFVEPDGLVINPTDWQTLRLAKDANSQYFAGGPFTGAYGNTGQATDSLWGLRAVVTPAIAAGTALVGSFSMCAQVFRQGGVTVEATNSNEDDFKNNLVALRAEERLLLAVYRPSGFGKVTGL